MFEKLKAAGRSLKRELKVYQLVIKDRRTPRAAKIVLGMAVGYALMPFDLIPDFIPVLGHLDDVIILPLLVIIALKMVPREVIDDCRAQVRDAGAAALRLPVHGSATQPSTEGGKAMATPLRIRADEVYQRVQSGGVLLVCAYDSDEKYAQFKLAGSLPFSTFKGMLAGLPKTQEIIFYCA